MTEEVINEEEIAVAQPWRDAMNRQVHNIIVSTLEASETMLEELDPDSDPEELHIELIAVALSAVAAMGGVSKENFMEMAKSAAQGVSRRRRRGRRLASNSIHSAAIKGRPSGRPARFQKLSPDRRQPLPTNRSAKVRNAGWQFAWANDPVMRIVPKTLRWSRSNQAEPARFIPGSPSLV